MSAPSTATTDDETERGVEGDGSNEDTTENESDIPLPGAWNYDDDVYKYATIAPTEIDSKPPSKGGFDLIKTLENDHRYCSHCFRKLKSIEQPPEHSRSKGERIKVTNAAVGFQWPEIHTIQTYTPRNESVGYHPWRAELWKVDQGDGALRPARSCSCGCIAHRTRRRPLSTTEAVEFTTNLSVAAWEIHHEHHYLSTLDADRIAYRNFRISSSMIHDIDALRLTMKKLKQSPELTSRNMGSWDDPDDDDPDELFRRAFDFAARKGDQIVEHDAIPSLEDVRAMRQSISDPSLDVNDEIREQRSRHRRRRYRGGREPPRRRRQSGE